MMGTRTFYALVALLWCSTMGWLFVSKVMPPMFVGEPPADSRQSENVGWRLIWNGEDHGWAVSRGETTEANIHEIRSRVVLRDISLTELAPAWVSSIVRDEIAKIDLDARTRMEFDPLGRMTAFSSSVRLADMPAAIRMVGHLENDRLALTVTLGEVRREIRLPIERGMLIAREFSPQTEIGKLHVGQCWTVRSFGSSIMADQGVEILQASVECEEMIRWDGKGVRTFVVVYRADSGAGLDRSAHPRGKLWVDNEGRVLQQEVNILSSSLRFVRMNDEDSLRQLEKMNWSQQQEMTELASEEAPAEPATIESPIDISSPESSGDASSDYFNPNEETPAEEVSPVEATRSGIREYYKAFRNWQQATPQEAAR